MDLRRACLLLLAACLLTVGAAEVARADGHWERDGGARFPNGTTHTEKSATGAITQRTIQGNSLTQEVVEPTMGSLDAFKPLERGVKRWAVQSRWADPPARLEPGETFHLACELRALSGDPPGGAISAHTRQGSERGPAARDGNSAQPVLRFTPARDGQSARGTLTLAARRSGDWFEVVLKGHGGFAPSPVPIVYRYVWVDDVLRYGVELIDVNPALYGGKMPEAISAAELAASTHVRRGTVTDGVSRLVVRVHKERDEPVQVTIVEGGGVLSALPARKHQLPDGSWYGFLLYTPRDAFGGGARTDRPRAVFDPAAQPRRRLEEVLEVEDLVLSTQALRRTEDGQWVPQGEPRTFKGLLARPPVVLVHGLFSNPVDCWIKSRTSGQSFAALLEQAGIMPFLVSYRHSNGGADQRRPSTFASNARVVWESPDGIESETIERGWFKDPPPESWLVPPREGEASDFQRVKAVRLGGIREALDYYRERLGLAATQADVVGHSMGGVLARVYAAQPDYRRPENFEAGDIHRLVTICSPHFGSELPELRGQIENARLEDEPWEAWMRRTLTAWITWAFLGPQGSGALKDLAAPAPGGNEAGGALAAIGATPIPSFAIATHLDNHLLGQPNADLNRYYLHVYGALAMMYFHNRPLLDDLIRQRAEAWRGAGALQRRADRAGHAPDSGAGGVIDWSGAAGAALFRRVVAEAIDESVYYWELRRAPGGFARLEEQIRAARLAPAGWLDGGLSDALARDAPSLRDAAALRLGGLLVKGDLARLADARAVQDVPLPVIGIVRDLIFHNDANDGTVRVVSQLGGLPETSTATLPGISHSLAPWSYPVTRQVIDLLKWEDERFARDGFPRAGEPMPCYLPSLTWSSGRVAGREAVRWSGYVAGHAAIIGDVADARDVILVGRPVNRDCTRLLAEGAAAKGMAVKGKTSNWGPQRGLICLDQRFSKIWRVYATDAARRDAQVAKYSKQTQANLTDTYPPEGGDPAKVGRTFAVKRALELPIRGDPVYAVLVDPQEPDAERAVYLRDRRSGTFVDWRNVTETVGGTPWPNFDADAPLAPLAEPPPEVVARLEPMFVLADGLSDLDPKPYLTADYDLLAIGFRRTDGLHGPPPEVRAAPFHPLRGAISPRQLDLVHEINEAVATRARHPSGDVTHHGPENQYADSPYVDYPLLVFDPGTPGDGKAEVFLVRQGPVGYRDLHLKRYFVEAVRRGYNLYENGESKVGWLWTAHREFSRERGYDPRDAKDLGPYVAEQPRPPPEPTSAGGAPMAPSPESVLAAVGRLRQAAGDAAALLRVLADLAAAQTLPAVLEVLAREGYLGSLLQTLVKADSFRALASMLEPADLSRTLARWVAAGHHTEAIRALADGGHLGTLFKDLAGTPLMDPVVETLSGKVSMGSVYEALDEAGYVEVAEELTHALRRLAREGDPFAMAELGLRLAAGDGNAPAAALAEALPWLRMASERGVPEAMAELARRHLYGWGVEKDAERAFAWFRKAADQGNAVGMNGLAILYEAGVGTKQNLAEARRLFEAAVAAGSEKAAYNLGNLHARGEGGSPDAARAFHYYSVAAQRGFAPGLAKVGECYEFGRGTPQDFAEARRWYAKGAEQAYGPALYRLATMTAFGRGGPKDPGRAAALYERAGALGVADAFNSLGLLYERGEGVPRNYERARALYEQGAEGGSALANLGLGNLYLNGVGVEKDFGVATRYFLRAVELGSPDAMNNLGWAYQHGGPGLEADPRKAFAWYGKAARGGSAEGRFNLGSMYQGGTGVATDLVEAYAWYSVAAAEGIEEAARARDALESSLTREQIRRGQERAEAIGRGE